MSISESAVFAPWRGTPQEQEKPLDLGEAAARGKRERQAVLKRVRQQRAIAIKRLAAKLGRV